MPKKKTVISFGLVTIPVYIEKLIKPHDIRFNYLCKKSKTRVEYKKVCQGEEEVKMEDLVKGYRYAEDEYIILSDEEMTKLQTKKDKMINILSFFSVKEIDVLYLDEVYLLTPQDMGVKGYDLLFYAMKNSNLCGLARTSFSTSEHLIALIGDKRGLLAYTLHYADEVKFDKEYHLDKINKNELAMAKELIKALTKPFNINDYKDEYQVRLEAAIAAKIAGRKIIKTQDKEEKTPKSLLSALSSSLKNIERDSARH